MGYKMKKTGNQLFDVTGDGVKKTTTGLTNPWFPKIGGTSKKTKTRNSHKKKKN